MPNDPSKWTEARDNDPLPIARIQQNTYNLEASIHFLMVTLVLEIFCEGLKDGHGIHFRRPTRTDNLVGTNCSEFVPIWIGKPIWCIQERIFGKYSQMECFVELGRPIITLGFGWVFSFLITQMWTDQIDLNKRAEHARCYPLQFIGCNHYNRRKPIHRIAHYWTRLADFFQCYLASIVRNSPAGNCRLSLY